MIRNPLATGATDDLCCLVAPVGENLFIAAYRLDEPIGQLALAVLPVVAVLLLAVLAVTHIPPVAVVGREAGMSVEFPLHPYDRSRT